MGISVVIPHIKPRKVLLKRALTSIEEQTLSANQVIVEEDVKKEGPAVVRNRALAKVEHEWTAFLDDDDEMLSHHLSTLYDFAIETGADLVWPWFRVVGGSDPFPKFRGRQWNSDDPHQIPITVLVRTGLLREVGGFETVGDNGPTDKYGNRAGEDWRLWLALSQAGTIFAHTPAITWLWHHDSRNTSGLPSRW